MTSKDNKLPKLEYEIEEMPGCCGIGVVHHIREDDGYFYWGSRKHIIERLFTTKARQAKDFITRINKSLIDSENGYSYGMVNLVSKYAKGSLKMQVPEVHSALLKDGWHIQAVFVNPNHGNEITSYGKFIEGYDPGTPDDDDDF